MEAGTSDLPVGTPLAVLVEDEADIAAFASATLADFAEGDSGAAAPAPAEAEPVEAPAAEAVAPPPAAASPAPAPPAQAAQTPAAPRPAGDVSAILASDRYGNSMRTSTLSAFLLEQQAQYVAKYGKTGLEVTPAGAEEQ